MTAEATHTETLKNIVNKREWEPERLKTTKEEQLYVWEITSKFFQTHGLGSHSFEVHIPNDFEQSLLKENVKLLFFEKAENTEDRNYFFSAVDGLLYRHRVLTHQGLSLERIKEAVTNEILTVAVAFISHRRKQSTSE